MQKHVNIITMKEFLKVFNYDNFGVKACELINKEFKSKLNDQLQKNKNIDY